MNVQDPYKYETHGHCACFLTIIEDKSRCTWTYLFANNSQVPSIILAYLSYVSTHFKTSVKAVRSNNGSDFNNHTLKTEFANLGVHH